MSIETAVNEKRELSFFTISCISIFLLLFFLNRDVARIGVYLLAVTGLFLIYKDGLSVGKKSFVLKASVLFVILMLFAALLSNVCCDDKEYYSKPFVHLIILFPFVLMNMFLTGWMRWLLNVSIFYAVVCIASYVFSDFPLISAKYFESRYAVYLLLAPIAYVILKSHIQPKTITIVFALSGVIVGMGAIADATDFARSQHWLFDEYPVKPDFENVGIGLGMNSIHFGIVTAALLAVVVANISINTTGLSKIEISLSVISIILLCFALALSGARSGWISLPFIFLIAFVSSPWSARTKWVAFLLLVLGLLAAANSPYVQKRFLLVSDQITRYVNSTDANDSIRRTSVGLRFDLWRAAWEVFLDNPVVGSGPGNFRSGMQKLSLDSTGKYNEDLVIHKNPHSLYFKALAERGVLGLISTLLVIAIPAVLFLTSAGKKQKNSTRAIAVSGLLVVIVFSLGGLTIGSLHKTELSIFYIFFIALFFGLLQSRVSNN